MFVNGLKSLGQNISHTILMLFKNLKHLTTSFLMTQKNAVNILLLI